MMKKRSGARVGATPLANVDANAARVFLAGATPGVMSGKHMARTRASDEECDRGTCHEGRGTVVAESSSSAEDGEFSFDYEGGALSKILSDMDVADEALSDDSDDSSDSTVSMSRRVNAAFEAFASLAFLAASPSEFDVTKRKAPTPANTPAFFAHLPSSPTTSEDDSSVGDVVAALKFESPDVGVPREIGVSPMVARLVRSITVDIEREVNSRAAERRRRHIMIIAAIVVVCAIVCTVTAVALSVVDAWAAKAAAAGVAKTAVAAVEPHIEGWYFIPRFDGVAVWVSFSGAPYASYGPFMAAKTTASTAATKTQSVLVGGFHRGGAVGLGFIISTLRAASAATRYAAIALFVLAALSKIKTECFKALVENQNETPPRIHIAEEKQATKATPKATPKASTSKIGEHVKISTHTTVRHYGVDGALENTNSGGVGTHLKKTTTRSSYSPLVV